MKPVKQALAVTVNTLLLSAAVSTANAAPSTYDAASAVLDIPEVDVYSGTSVDTFSAKLKLVSASEPYILELMGASAMATAKSADRSVYFGDTTNVHIPSVEVGGVSYYAKLKLVPGSNPLRFTVDQLETNDFSGCPSFATAASVAETCVLSGVITEDVTLTSDTTWLIAGDVYIGEDNANSATLTINPGTTIVGQNGADFLWVRRGSKIYAEGTPNNPIMMTGSREQEAGEWGGLVISGNAPVNGCDAGVELCEVAFEAIPTELYGGNDESDDSGVVKYTQIKYAGFEVRPNQELNGFTLNGVGSGTLIDYVQVHEGVDDGVEMFGGTVQMKHMVLSNIRDDSLDWGQGWRGKAQFVLIKQGENHGDRGIEADNNEDDNDATPRAKPMLSNLTALGSSVSTQGALLRRGTGANIYNSVFQGFGDQCLRIDGEATYLNAGTPGNLTGELTIAHSYVNCDTNYKDEADMAFLVSDWFTSQMANVAADPQLDGYLPAAGSPLTSGGMNVSDAFFTPVDYIGAFKDADSDWTAEWTEGL